MGKFNEFCPRNCDKVRTLSRVAGVVGGMLLLEAPQFDEWCMRYSPWRVLAWLPTSSTHNFAHTHLIDMGQVAAGRPAPIVQLMPSEPGLNRGGWCLAVGHKCMDADCAHTATMHKFHMQADNTQEASQVHSPWHMCTLDPWEMAPPGCTRLHQSPLESTCSLDLRSHARTCTPQLHNQPCTAHQLHT